MDVRSSPSRDCWLLVIEDDADIRETLSDIIREEGYTVVTADSGPAGLATLEARGEPCLILVDYIMPSMTGVGFIETLRAGRYAHLPVCLMSAGTIGDLPSGVATLSKPLDVDKLLKLVETHCRVRENRGTTDAGAKTPYLIEPSRKMIEQSRSLVEQSRMRVDRASARVLAYRPARPAPLSS